MLEVPTAGPYYRVADPSWSDPLDPTYASAGAGQRWNPSGLPCLYLNADVGTARANVARLHRGLPYGPEDLDPATAPLLVEVEIPSGVAADAFSGAGLAVMGLPPTYPLDASGDVVAHSVCQPLGNLAFDNGLDGVDCRSATPGGTRELAWYPRSSVATELSRRAFSEWW
ncbi:MAG: RES family NAD+ phosphorylase [Acidimicrobiaceae bacterium]|nr:RES family NAD+ phosphorylase [Ilumatobacter sp.]MCB9382548.1 RES family NAD+ phosphorylase [Acidimicrobiaceae bacterium]